MTRKHFIEALKADIENWNQLVSFLFDGEDGKRVVAGCICKIIESDRSNDNDHDQYIWIFSVDNSLLLKMVGRYSSHEGYSLDRCEPDDLVQVKPIKKEIIVYQPVGYNFNNEIAKERDEVNKKLKELQKIIEEKEEKKDFLDI